MGSGSRNLLRSKTRPFPRRRRLRILVVLGMVATVGVTAALAPALWRRHLFQQLLQQHLEAPLEEPESRRRVLERVRQLWPEATYRAVAWEDPRPWTELGVLVLGGRGRPSRYVVAGIFVRGGLSHLFTVVADESGTLLSTAMQPIDDFPFTATLTRRTRRGVDLLVVERQLVRAEGSHSAGRSFVAIINGRATCIRTENRHGELIRHRGSSWPIPDSGATGGRGGVPAGGGWPEQLAALRSVAGTSYRDAVLVSEVEQVPGGYEALAANLEQMATDQDPWIAEAARLALVTLSRPR